MFRYYDASKSLLWLCIGTIMITISSSFVLKPNGGVSLLSKNYLAADRTKAVVQPIRTTNPITLTTTQLFSNKVEATIDTKFMWNSGLSFGKGQFKFYKSFNEYMSVFPAEDRNNNPELFNLPTGLYEVSLRKPMGIVFEEIEMNKGLYVKDIVPGGNADVDGTIKENDILVGITAVKVVGAKYERRLIPCRGFNFDTMVGAVSSNDERYSCYDVILIFERPSDIMGDDFINKRYQIDQFMAFFEPPFDNPWKQPQ